MNSWSTFSPSHGASSVSQWSYGLSIYVHTQDTIHIPTHICTTQCNHIHVYLTGEKRHFVFFVFHPNLVTSIILHFHYWCMCYRRLCYIKNYKCWSKEDNNKHVYFYLTLLDVDLLVCKHQGPSCCTRKMEESYTFAVRRETLHNIHSYSYELEHLLSGHSDAFQGKCLDRAWVGWDWSDTLCCWWMGKSCYTSTYLWDHIPQNIYKLDPALSWPWAELRPPIWIQIQQSKPKKLCICCLACREYLFVQYLVKKSFHSVIRVHGSWRAGKCATQENGHGFTFPPPPFFCGFGSTRSAEKDRLG